MWICLVIDEDSRKEIVSLCKKHMEGLDLSSRFLDFPLHVSLKRSFYTDAFEQVKADLCGSMKDVISFEVKELSLERAEDLLWIRVDDEKLDRILEQIDGLLKERYGIDIDAFDRNYLAHITLFRDQKKEKLDAMYERLKNDWKDRTVRFTSFYIGSRITENEFFELNKENGPVFSDKNDVEIGHPV